MLRVTCHLGIKQTHKTDMLCQRMDYGNTISADYYRLLSDYTALLRSVFFSRCHIMLTPFINDATHDRSVLLSILLRTQGAFFSPKVHSASGNEYLEQHPGVTMGGWSVVLATLPSLYAERFTSCLILLTSSIRFSKHQTRLFSRDIWSYLP